MISFALGMLIFRHDLDCNVVVDLTRLGLFLLGISPGNRYYQRTLKNYRNIRFYQGHTDNRADWFTSTFSCNDRIKLSDLESVAFEQCKSFICINFYADYLLFTIVISEQTN